MLTLGDMGELDHLRYLTRVLEQRWRNFADRTGDTGMGIVHSRIASAQDFLDIYTLDHGLDAPQEASGTPDSCPWCHDTGLVAGVRCQFCTRGDGVIVTRQGGG